MHIFFDVDYTILGRDSTLRPGTHEVFTRLREDGHHVYVWSGEGVRWGVVRNHGLEHLVHGVYGKPLQDYENRLEEFGVPVVPDFVIDDYPGIVRAFGGVCITDYLGKFDGREDRELEIVYEIICAHHAGDVPDHPRYYPTPPTFPTSTGEPKPLT
jgi:hypothetical protein